MSDKKSDDLLSWLGFSATPDFSKSKTLGACLGVMTVILVGGLFGLAIMAAFKMLASSLLTDLPKGTASRFGLSGVIVAMVGAPFVVWRTSVAHKQANISEKGFATDRLNRAFENLGAEKTVHSQLGEQTVPNLEVRLGALLSLSRILEDSPQDYLDVLNMICLFIRNNAQIGELLPEIILERRPIPRMDIQAAIDVLSRRPSDGIAIEARHKFRIDLQNSNLSGVNFNAGNFDAALLNNSKLEGARLDNATFRGSYLIGANLRYATFVTTDLTGARVDEAVISPTNGYNSINRAILFGTCLYGTEMSNVFMKTTLQEYPTIGNADTTFAGIPGAEVAEYLKAVEHFEIFKVGEHDEDQARKQLNVGGLNYWSAFKNHDLANGFIFKNARDKLGLTGWPFED